jgi:predicted kinase
MNAFGLPFVPAPGDGFDWPAMNRAYPWLSSLANTPQDPVYHGEGDAGTHTRMVLEVLVQTDQWQKLPQTERGLLFWAALLHDIAKPDCTHIDPDGRIHSPNHTIRGEGLAREILYKGIPDPVPFALREKIAKLVRFHGMPRWLVDNNNPLKKVIRASQVVDLKHLTLLSEADFRGRLCDDADDGLERVRLFAQYASEVGCYDRPYPFETDLARITYLKGGNNSPAYVPYDTTWGEVILMAGLPGAGKDTWIHGHAGRLPMISLDAMRTELGVGPQQNQGRVIQEAKARARALLRAKSPFVWNATNITGHLRAPLVDLFLSYGARVKIVYVEAPYVDLIRQNEDRRDSVPADILQRLLRKLEVPDVTEANEVEYCCP